MNPRWSAPHRLRIEKAFALEKADGGGWWISASRSTGPGTGGHFA
jgi:hypothetical protein